MGLAETVARPEAVRIFAWPRSDRDNPATAVGLDSSNPVWGEHPIASASHSGLYVALLGIFLPLLPTTPFLLLTAFCYTRSSKRFYDWLTTNRWCGAYIRNYREGRGIPRQQKALTIALLWATIGATAWFAVSLWWMRLMLLIIASAVTIHLLCIKTFKNPVARSPEGLPAERAPIALPEKG